MGYLLVLNLFIFLFICRDCQFQTLIVTLSVVAFLPPFGLKLN